MEIEKKFENSNFTRKKIVYPPYQTTNRYRNLYSDVRTFIRELIQNADDSEAKTIKFNIKLTRKEVEVINDGHAFDSNDIERLLTPCLGGKEFDKTGAMNLGALSVLSVSDEPIYHSGKTLLKFEMDHDLEDFTPYINEDYESYFNGTRLVLPLHSRLSKDNKRKLDKIDEYLTKNSHLLFTLNLNKILLNYPNKRYEISKKIEETDTFQFKNLNIKLNTVTISEKITEGKKNRINDNTWYIAKYNVVVPKKYFNKRELDRIEKEIEVPIYLAFLIENDLPTRVEYLIYIVFPSDTTYGIGCVISSNFRPETSRKGFSTDGLDGEFNIFLLKQASVLIELVLLHFKKKISLYPILERKRFFDALLISSKTLSFAGGSIKLYCLSKNVHKPGSAIATFDVLHHFPS